MVVEAKCSIGHLAVGTAVVAGIGCLRAPKVRFEVVEVVMEVLGSELLNVRALEEVLVVLKGSMRSRMACMTYWF